MHKLMVTALVNRFHCSPQKAIAIVNNKPKILKDFPAFHKAEEMLQSMNGKDI